MSLKESDRLEAAMPKGSPALSSPRFPLRYFVVTFAWTWSFWSILILMGLGVIRAAPEFKPVLIGLGGAGPAIGALFSIRSLEGKDKLRLWLKSFLDLRWGWKAWLLSVLFFFSVFLIAWLVPEFFGEPRLASKLPSLFLLPLIVVQMILIGGGGEEFGWRGYILDPLEERLGAWGGNLVLAAAWGLWHLPLWFVPGTNQSQMNYGAFLLEVTGLCFIIRRFRVMAGKRRSSSIWFHALVNSFFPLFPLLSSDSGARQPRFWLFASLLFASGIALMAQETPARGKRSLDGGVRVS